MIDEFITDDQLCDALGLQISEYHKIVDWLRLKQYNITGIVKVIKTDSFVQIKETLDSICSHNFNNISPKVVWAWNINFVECIAQKIIDFKQLHPTVFSCD